MPLCRFFRSRVRVDWYEIDLGYVTICLLASLRLVDIAGPLSNWIAACELMLGMDVETVIPGHGPVTDKRGVAAVRDYLAYIDAETTARFHVGMGAWDAARNIALDGFAALGERGRIAVTVEAVYRTLDPAHRSPSIVELFRRMAALERPGA